MTFNSTFNAFNQSFFNVYSLITSNPVVVASTTFSSFILLALLLVSLGLTFHAKGTTVHKVLGLLLTSIFVVFLWMLQSQFLFIYVVYILAFISAVLMLFLSVVLMLPISTLTTKNTLTDQKNKHKAYFFVVVITQDCLTISTASTMAAITLILVFFSIKSMRHYNVTALYNDLIEYSKYHFKISNQISINNFFNKTKKQVKFNKPTLTFVSFLYSSALQIGNTGWKVALDFKQENTNISNVKYIVILWLTLGLTMSELMLRFLRDLSFMVATMLKYNIRVAFQTFKIINKAPFEAVKVLWDVVAQTYLFATVLLSMVSLFLSSQTALQAATNVLANDSSQGLGQIKGLLYGDFSLFLLFSTLVLLIALLGAAVMTRNKR